MSLLKQLYGVDHSDIFPKERKEIDRIYRRILDIRRQGTARQVVSTISWLLF